MRETVNVSSVDVQVVPADRAPMDLLLEADPSEEKVRAYLRHSTCYLARLNGAHVGVYVLRSLSDARIELMNIAVAPAHRRRGLGAMLLRHAIESAKRSGARRLELGTGTFGHQLAFYQRAGFRVVAVEKDYFLKHYPSPLIEQGIQHKDRLWLELAL